LQAATTRTVICQQKSPEIKGGPSLVCYRPPVDLTSDRDYLRAELEAFGRELTSLTLAQEERLPGLAADEMTSFCSLLARERMERACRHLQAAPENYPYILQFLEFVRQMDADRIRHAETISEAQDALLCALDNIHSYLLAHELVSEAYLEEEFKRSDELFPEFKDSRPARLSSSAS
jgi:hypothetical protein